MIAIATAAAPDPIPTSASPEVLDRVLDAVEALSGLMFCRATDAELAKLAGLPNAKALAAVLAELRGRGDVSIKRVEGRRLLCAAPRRWPRSGKAGRA
jgi:hypothetical protein